MTILIATDLHLSDRPRDDYRFGLFDFLKKQIIKREVDLLLILGDLTDLKDNHSSQLVNQIVKGLSELAAMVPVIILKGNHDYLANPDNPFFDFLNHIKNIRFITKQTLWTNKMDKRLLFIPHVENSKKWNNLKVDGKVDYAFIHQTVAGAMSESGRRLNGYAVTPLKALNCPVYGGDVHLPHTVDPVIYVGPPYHVKFGDDYIPRCMVLDEQTGETIDVHYKCPRKWSLRIREPEELRELEFLRAEDQVKVSIELTKEEVLDYQTMKEKISLICRDLGLQVFGIELKIKKQTKLTDKEQKRAVKDKSPDTILKSFSKREKLSKAVLEVGKEFLN